MDLETFLQSCFSFLKTGDNLYVVVYAVITCILTQVLKKAFVNKVNSDVLHKFDFACIMPFIIGTAFAFCDVFYINKIDADLFGKICSTAVGGATTGALASVIFRFFSSLSGQSLKSLLADDVFGVFYNQLLYFGNVREKLLSKELSMKDFVAEVKLLAENAKVIYAEDISDEEKYARLRTLLLGIVSDESVTTCLGVISRALTVTCTDKKRAETVATK